MKMHLHQRTEEPFSSNEENGGDDDDRDIMELSRNKKVKKNYSETEADSSTLEQSCFVARVTASNLHNDALYLPKDFTSSTGFKTICRNIVLVDGGEKSWALDLRFDKSFDTFYISRGWRNFCDENSKKAGSYFMFKLVGNGETPVLSFSHSKSKGEKSIKKESLPVDRSSGKQIREEAMKNNHLRYSESTSTSQNRLVTLTVTHGKQNLPLPFMRKNGLDEPGMITLLGKDGTKWLANRVREATGGMSWGKGWKEFAKANGLKTGESFTLESIWRDTIPMLRLYSEESTSDSNQQGEGSKDSEKESMSTEPSNGNKTKKDKNIREERSPRELVRNKCLPNKRDSLSPIQDRLVTLTLASEDLTAGKLELPSQFIRASGINKLGKITPLGKDGMKCSAFLLTRDGFVAIGNDWTEFCEANGVKIGDSFSLEIIHEQDAIPVFKFFSSSRD